MDTRDEKDLRVRYLVWLYKTTKEAFDRYERTFTQLEIDRQLLFGLEKEFKGAFLPHEKKALERSINDFRDYIAQKESKSLKLKYKGKCVNPEFLFLDVKLEVIEGLILRELGKRSLASIKEAYQQEMIARIMEEREHAGKR